MRPHLKVVLAPVILTLLVTSGIAATTITHATVSIRPEGTLQVTVSGTFIPAELSGATSLTIRVGSQEQSIPLSAFRACGPHLLILNQTPDAALVRSALLNCTLGTFRLSCESSVTADHVNPLVFEFGFGTPWRFDITIDPTRPVSGFQGTIPGTQIQGFGIVRMRLVDEDLATIGGPDSTNVPRDAWILIEFTDPVDWSSVTDRTVQIGVRLSGGLLRQAIGRFETVPGRTDQILFNPLFSKNNPGTVPDNPLGLEASTLHEVRVPSIDDQAATVLGASGDPVEESYAAQFTTGTGYAHEYGPPTIVRTSPLPGDEDVGSTEDVLVEFSVPVHPATLEVGRSILVESLTTLDQLGRPTPVLGSFQLSPDLEIVTFRPVIGYGPGPETIRVRITTDVTSLSGEPLEAVYSFQFTTEYDPTQPIVGYLRETFDDSAQEDTAFSSTLPRAAWNATGDEGLLVGTSSQSEARSLWYDTGVSGPQFLEPIYAPTLASLPPGTSMVFTFQGARPVESDPTVPDETSVSAWVSDLVDLSGYRFVRFNVVTTASPGTGAQPWLDEVHLVFVFF